MPHIKPAILCILDGWGMAPEGLDATYNAVAQANTPVFDGLWRDHPHRLLRADGPYVGLPEGQFGNSEVGHLTIGSGRILKQDLPRISDTVTNNTLSDIEALQKISNQLNKTDGVLHLFGLVSDGGVHSHINHLFGLLTWAKAHHIRTATHIVTDGRDTAPRSAETYLAKLEAYIADLDHTGTRHRIATVMGRYYAMDRDNRWERVAPAFHAIMHGQSETRANDGQSALKHAYELDLTDEFIKPTVLSDYDGHAPKDAFLCINFRADRVREIMRAITHSDFNDFERGEGYMTPSSEQVAGMTAYADDLAAHMQTLFPPQRPTQTLGEVVAKAGLSQLRAAETEKFPHVTFFLNGGRENPFDGEARILVPSPKVATYDLQPEMSADQLTSDVVAHLKTVKPALTVINYANPDMVGHTGDLAATIKAVETVDACLGQLWQTAQEMGLCLVVTADHGNADCLLNTQTGKPHTAHTTAPVPFIVCGQDHVSLSDIDAGLADIAPTILALMGIEKPDEMSGKALV